ncbi:unnamed protein product [Dimorphilus gyrociliatus]|uniref:Uncharacterized protein n=1 Tax=Dimorphilus gyrociliatus TaxID=2664684 RepID=A0A7I8WA40_9ANNE|nr:unnamed protein product [Dimorphilus gyrociliatus]
MLKTILKSNEHLNRSTPTIFEDPEEEKLQSINLSRQSQRSVISINVPQQYENSKKNSSEDLSDERLLSRQSRRSTSSSRTLNTPPLKKLDKHRNNNNKNKKKMKRKDNFGLSPAEEEALRTKEFWEHWGAEMTIKILRKRQIELDKEEENYPQISGRIYPEPRIPRRDSTESLVTNLSLFSTSDATTVEADTPDVKLKTTMKRRRKPKTIKPTIVKEAKVDWEKLAREKNNSILNKLMGGKKEDHLSNEEWELLISCSKRKGLIGREKSKSTANVLSTIEDSDEMVEWQMESFKDYSDEFKLPETRPLSVELGSVNSSIQRDLDAQRAHLSTAPARTSNFSFEDPEHRKKIRQRLSKTINSLSKITGLGDNKNVCRQNPEEIGRYTAEDYSKICRYPQRLKVAPQLAQVVKYDIIKRMGTPKLHRLSISDIKNLNDANPVLGRIHRNLLVFNWLNDIDGNYDICQ